VQVRELTLMIGTAQPAALARFYGGLLGLPRVERFADPVFEAAGGFIRILKHSEIAGPTQEPARLQINLFVEDAAAEFARVLAADASIEVQRAPARESWGGLVATLRDPDGNFVQLLEMP